MSSKLLVLILAIFILPACNYKLFVNRRYVVRREQGFLLFRGDNEVTFYTSRDTVDSKFFSKKRRKEGYKVDFDTGWLDSLSVDYSYISSIKGLRISVIPVEITYYLGEVWQKKDVQNSIEYTWKGKLFTLRFKQHDWRQILMITVVRDNDEKRIKNLHFEPVLYHY